MWLTLLKRFWPYLAVAGLLIGVWLWHLSAIHKASREGYQKAQAEYSAQLEAYRQHQREVNEESERVYQANLAKVRSDASRELRGRPIRCVLDSGSEVRTGPDTAQPVDGPGGKPAVRPSEDLRSLIVRRGEVCEGLRQQLIQIRERQEAIAQAE